MTTDIEQIDIAGIEADIADSPEYWEAVREAAEELLATVKPRSAKARIARQHLAEYEDWRRTYLVPKKWTGVWKRTDKGYFIKTAKSARAGDTCAVRLRDGTQRVFVLDEGGEGLWLGHRIDGDNAVTEVKSVSQDAETRADAK
jgi:hypothetical protein